MSPWPDVLENRKLHYGKKGIDEKESFREKTKTLQGSYYMWQHKGKKKRVGSVPRYVMFKG